MNTDNLILERFITRHSHQASRILNEFSAQSIADFVHTASQSTQVDVFNLLDRYKAFQTFELIDRELAKTIIENLPPQKAAIILRQLDKKIQSEILDNINKDIATPLKLILSYAPGSVGANMDTSVLALSEEISVREAIKVIKKNKQLKAPLVFVITDEEKLSGVADLQSLIAASANDKLQSVVKKDVPRIFAQVNANTVLDHEGWLQYNLLPVVDRSDIFLGAISLENIRDAEDTDRDKFSKQAQMTSRALGDLYKIGLGSFIRIAGEQFGKTES